MADCSKVEVPPHLLTSELTSEGGRTGSGVAGQIVGLFLSKLAEYIVPDSSQVLTCVCVVLLLDRNQPYYHRCVGLRFSSLSVCLFLYSESAHLDAKCCVYSMDSLNKKLLRSA